MSAARPARRVGGGVRGVPRVIPPALKPLVGATLVVAGLVYPVRVPAGARPSCFFAGPFRIAVCPEGGYLVYPPAPSPNAPGRGAILPTLPLPAGCFYFLYGRFA